MAYLICFRKASTTSSYEPNRPASPVEGPRRTPTAPEGSFDPSVIACPGYISTPSFKASSKHFAGYKALVMHLETNPFPLASPELQQPRIAQFLASLRERP